MASIEIVFVVKIFNNIVLGYLKKSMANFEWSVHIKYLLQFCHAWQWCDPAYHLTGLLLQLALPLCLLLWHRLASHKNEFISVKPIKHIKFRWILWQSARMVNVGWLSGVVVSVLELKLKRSRYGLYHSGQPDSSSGQAAYTYLSSEAWCFDQLAAAINIV